MDIKEAFYTSPFFIELLYICFSPLGITAIRSVFILIFV